MKPISLSEAHNGLVPVPTSPDYCPCVDLVFESGSEPELPDEGTITFRYRVRREVENYDEGTCRFELKLEEITAFKASASKTEKDEGEDALDRLAKEVMDEETDEEGDE